MGRRCMGCHDGSNPHLPNLKGHENVMTEVDVDKGMTIATLISNTYESGYRAITGKK